MRVIVLDKESYTIHEYYNVTKIEYIESNSSYQVTGVFAETNAPTIGTYGATRFLVRIMSN